MLLYFLHQFLTSKDYERMNDQMSRIKWEYPHDLLVLFHFVYYLILS